jgi:hypothetical protein
MNSGTAEVAVRRRNDRRTAGLYGDDDTVMSRCGLSACGGFGGRSPAEYRKKNCQRQPHAQWPGDGL